MKFTLSMHPWCHFRPALPLNRPNPNDLQSKTIGWFLYNGNSANLRYHIFHVLFSILLKTLFTVFLKCQTKPDLTLENIIPRIQTKKC